MLDKKLEMLLAAANTLTADDLDCLRGVASVAAVALPDEEAEAEAPVAPDVADAPSHDSCTEAESASPSAPALQRVGHVGRRRVAVTASGVSAGEYERQRTRESKVSTACIGHERERHDWWPVGTELIGQIGSGAFTATVVENPQVKSNRSILITSGAAAGKLCITPTRAAMEATEAFRQAHNLGRGGGVTNGWDFWKAQA